MYENVSYGQEILHLLLIKKGIRTIFIKSNELHCIEYKVKYFMLMIFLLVKLEMRVKELLTI